MPELEFNNTTTTGLDSGVDKFSVDHETLDTAGANKETEWNNSNWSEYLGYYKTIPELKQAIDSLAVWTAGKGFETIDNRTRLIVDNVIGWGEDSFESIMKNMLIVKKINGDAYAEIIKDKNGLLVNLKPLNPATIKTIVNSKGIIIRYDEYNPKSKKVKRKYSPDDIFHISNNRVANEIHGVSVIEACKWVIDARNEAMSDWRRVLHRSSIRIMYVDVMNPTKLASLKEQYKEAINKGEVMIIPAKRGDDIEFEELTAPPIQAFLQWIQYLENFFYQAVGIPKIILGGSQDFTEASSKVGYLTFEQVYMTEQRELEKDILNQLKIEITFNRPVSLKDNVQSDEAANTGQVGFQPNELNVGVTRNE